MMLSRKENTYHKSLRILFVRMEILISRHNDLVFSISHNVLPFLYHPCTLHMVEKMCQIYFIRNSSMIMCLKKAMTALS